MRHHKNGSGTINLNSRLLDTAVIGYLAWFKDIIKKDFCTHETPKSSLSIDQY